MKWAKSVPDVTGPLVGVIFTPFSGSAEAALAPGCQEISHLEVLAEPGTAHPFFILVSCGFILNKSPSTY